MNINGPYLPYLKNKELFMETRSRLRQKRLEIGHWDKFKQSKNFLLETDFGEVGLEIGSEIKLIARKELSDSGIKKLKDCIQNLIPWRTGPFNIFGLGIDSEWKSNLRWDRLKPLLPPLKDAIISDVGCGNGYFMFRMFESKPKIIFGLDPQARCVYQFELLNSFLKEKRMLLEPLGIENMDVFTNYFDFVLCMGVIYHRRDPHTCLTKVKDSLKPGGTFIIESLVVEGDEPVSFSPPGRYMKMRNVWFVPTVSGICSWLEKCGFKDIKTRLVYDVGMDEQRTTVHSPDESLKDFLDPNNQGLTVEGYKVPKRAIISAIA